jgi:hypothetical protein
VGDNLIKKKNLKKEHISIEDILKSISDNKALVLFNTIALAEGTQIQIRKLGLTTRQYYSRLSRLSDTGLVTRRDGRYFLTLLGRILYGVHLTAGKALSCQWKLKAIESIQMTASVGVKLPEEEFSKVVDTLIDDYELKNTVVRALTSMKNDKRSLREEKEEEQEVKIKVRTPYLSKLAK